MTKSSPRCKNIGITNSEVKDMNLKEAFRYQNKIQALMCAAENILRNRANITKVTNTNLRHKVMPEASDETVVEIPGRPNTAAK